MAVVGGYHASQSFQVKFLEGKPQPQSLRPFENQVNGALPDIGPGTEGQNGTLRRDLLKRHHTGAQHSRSKQRDHHDLDPEFYFLKVPDKPVHAEADQNQSAANYGRIYMGNVQACQKHGDTERQSHPVDKLLPVHQNKRQTEQQHEGILGFVIINPLKPLFSIESLRQHQLKLKIIPVHRSVSLQIYKNTDQIGDDDTPVGKLNDVMPVKPLLVSAAHQQQKESEADDAVHALPLPLDGIHHQIIEENVTAHHKKKLYTKNQVLPVPALLPDRRDSIEQQKNNSHGIYQKKFLIILRMSAALHGRTDGTKQRHDQHDFQHYRSGSIQIIFFI